MGGLADYRLIDYVALALERGLGDAFSHAQKTQPIALGPLVEAISIAWTNEGIGPFLRQFGCQKLLQTIRASRKKPLVMCCGSDGDRHWGCIHFHRVTAETVREPLHGFELAARKAMQLPTFVNQTKANICGALQEMVDNILDHSESPQTGMAVFVGSSNQFEMSVGDAGIGMLASLQTNPAFSYLSDSGGAMAVGLADGNSRFGLGQDRGFGFGTLFRALNTLDAELRFRSGDYSLEIAAHSPTLRNPRISQKATLQGFVVSLKLTR